VKQAELLPLTSLRFIAALAVFGSHLPLVRGTDQPFLNWLGKYVLLEGYWGVAFFFILSGFILTIAYQNRLESKKDICTFWIARLARIYPLHLLTLVLAAFTINTAPFGIATFSNLLLLQSFIPSSVYYFAYNAPSWSLSNEAFFYLLFPLLLPISRRLRLHILGSWLIALWLLSGITALLLSPSYTWQHWVSYILPTTRLIEFGAGIFIGLLFLRFGEGWRTRVQQHTLLECLAVLLFVIIFALHSFIPQGLRYAFYYMPVFTIIVFVFAFQGGKLSHLLSHHLLVFLGEISFSFYMIHYLVIARLSGVLRRLPLAPIAEDSVLFAIVALAVSVAASIMLYKCFELPTRRLVRTAGSYLLERNVLKLRREG
jgi:peptidoglycan/LPS O-acetylase OafA/YrhL